MFSMLRMRFGIPGAIAVCALVFALLGGAYAASDSSGGKAAAFAKSKRGQRGPRGVTGPAGPAGLAGSQGAAGTNGKDGVNGVNGQDGAAGTPGAPGVPGKSVLASGELPGANCENGGARFEVEGSGIKHYACNGKDGANGATGATGATGAPWPVPGTLPSGATETGMYLLSKGVSAAISFPIPLAAPIEEEPRHIRRNETTAKGTFTPESPTQLITNVVTSKGEFEVGTPISGAGIPSGTTVIARSPEFGEFTEGSPGTLTLSQSVTEAKTKSTIKGGVFAECDNGEGVAASFKNPEADPGYFCLFASAGTAPEVSGFATGAFLGWESEPAFVRNGSFAVTAP